MELIPVVFLLLAPVLSSCSEIAQPVDCSDILQQDKSSFSGVYTIYPLGEKSAVDVYCDMDSLGGGWTVLQRRKDGSVNFYRPWSHYKFGFGNASGEYWIGLDDIYYLTSSRKYELLIDMEDFEGKQVYGRYASFSVSGECDGFRLTVAGFTNGGSGDALTYFNTQRFSTFDKDQDASALSNCARLYLGAFWYNNCHNANPNGIYRWGADGTILGVGVEWQPWKGVNYSLKAISMKIRPVH